MKRIKWAGLLSLFFLQTWSYAQRSYPGSPAPAADMIKGEYFFDNDPGYGKAYPISLDPAKNITGKTVELPIQNLRKGFHIFYLRTQDGNGKWSLLANRSFLNILIPAYGTPGSKSNLAEAEYFFDDDPGEGRATKINLSNGEDIQNVSFNINLNGLSKGLHIFHLRTKDATRKWSLTAVKIINYSGVIPYPAAPAAAMPVIAAEAFIDTDPGFGKGMAVTIRPAGDIGNVAFDIPLTGLAQGVHHLYVRSKESPWSLAAVRQFIYGSVLPLQWIYFKGEMKNGEAFLNWRTAAEINTDSFSVQQSIDGIHFSTIGSLAAANSGLENNYSFKDDEPADGFNFYRIRQTDRDGKSSYSAVIQLLHRNKRSAIILAPNPVINETYVLQQSAEFVRGYSISNAAGQIVATEQVNSMKEAVWRLDLGALRKGIYTLTINYKDHFQVLTFLKK